MANKIKMADKQYLETQFVAKIQELIEMLNLKQEKIYSKARKLSRIINY